jgi:hypothetical protein
MARTTIDIDNPILNEIKNMQKKDGRSIGKIVSQLLTEALNRHKPPVKGHRLKWASRPMGALLDLSDKDTLYKILDRSKR